MAFLKGDLRGKQNARKNTHTAGIPDIIVCYKGRFYGLEAKVGTNKPTRLQEATIAEIRKAGGVAGVVKSVDDVKALLHGEEET